METLRIGLEPASIPEWDAEDELNAVQADDVPGVADPATAREIIEKMVVELPKALDYRELIGAATEHKVAGSRFRIMTSGLMPSCTIFTSARFRSR
jgi:hypothetical protein